MKNIYVTSETWKQLNSIRKQYNYKNYNLVIIELLKLYEDYQTGKVVDVK